MPTQLELLRLVAPEFAAISDLDAQAFLDLAPLFIDVSLYPAASVDLALVYQAASLMFKQGQSSSGSSSGQNLIREKEGDLERAWSAGSSSRSSSTENIYDDLLTRLGMGIFGSTIMTRFGSVVPQAIE